MESFICSTCDGCSLQPESVLYEVSHEEHEQFEEENNKVTVVTAADIHNISSGTASWDYLEEPSLKNKTDSDVTTSTPTDLNRNENNLRRMLKESFGATNEDDNNHDNSNTNLTEIQNLNPKTADHQVYEAVVYSASDMEHNVEYEVNFLSEYSRKKSLFGNHSDNDNTLSEKPILPQVLDKSGNKVTVTEDIFRADIEGTLKRLDKKRKNASPACEASDSGIASPPPGGDVSIIRAPSTVNFTEDLDTEDRADSGLDNNNDKAKPQIVQIVPKRDTMIRELKSKLKQRFQAGDQLLEEETSTPAVVQAVHVPVGTVEAKKQLMNSQLSRVFAAKQTQTNGSGSSNSVKTVELPEKKLTNFAKIRQNRQSSPDSCSDCGEPIASPPPPPPASREMLYGPGGLFGPKGPFSTPNVRYPNGMEMPPRKSRNAGAIANSRYGDILLKKPLFEKFYHFLLLFWRQKI